MFRQNKRATDVHDIIGFRIVVTPRKKSRRVLASTSIDSRGHKKVNPNGHEESEGTERGEGMARHAENGVNVERTEKERQGKKGRVANKKGGSKPARKLFTVKTFPPPYRDADSKLLHDVYEVLVDLFDEVPGRYKVTDKFDIVRSLDYVALVLFTGLLAFSGRWHWCKRKRSCYSCPV